MTRVAILSDTHGYLDPRWLPYLNEVDEIWHAGDIGSDMVLRQLRELKPTRAVYGNCDGVEVRYSLTEFYRFRVEQMNVLLTHIGGYPNRYNPLALRQLQIETPDIFVCGHSHILKVQYDREWGLMHLNPGAAGRFGIHLVQTMIRCVIDGKELKDLEVIELQKA